MASKMKCIRALARELGEEYEVKVIDLEWVIHRDFHNGFDVEISGVYTTGKKKKALIFLWSHGWLDYSSIVKTVDEVKREDIGAVVEDLYAISESIREAGIKSYAEAVRWVREMSKKRSEDGCVNM